MAKRPSTRSPEEAVKAMVNVAKGPPPIPKHVTLRNGDRPFWDGIISARARDEWTDADLVVAAQLARCQADIEAEQTMLDTEGSVVTNARGTVVLNARVTVLQQYAQREMALMRTLRMGGRVAGASADEAGRRGLQKQAEKIRDELADEELLAT